MKSISLKFLLTGIALTLNCYLYAADVAKVIIMKGNALAILKDGQKLPIKLDMWLPEGAKIATEDRSFIKLLFIDKSQLNLGPKSEMIISSFPKNEAGIINLVKGQLRSKVTKDYMQINDKDKSKLFIKTASAAMGVRGTEFQVNYNEVNFNTSLITFEGTVRMAGIDKASREQDFFQRELEKMVSSDKSVPVREGQFSAVTQLSDQALVPALLAPTQLETLKKNESGIIENSNKGPDQVKNFNSPIPPGVDPTLFSNNTKQIDSEIANTIGNQEIVSKVGKEVEGVNTKTNTPAEGFYNPDTGAIKFPSGSVIDLKTVNVIPPPTNSVFDPNTKTFILPPNFGSIDKSTGNYNAPSGFKLNEQGVFVADETKNNNGRGPASKSDQETKPGMPISIVPTFIPHSLIKNLPFGGQRGPGSFPPPPGFFDPNKLQDLATSKQQDINNTINQASDAGTFNPRTQTRFIYKSAD